MAYNMNLSEFFEKLNYSIDEESKKYISNLDEVKLKLLVKRVYESDPVIKTELNKQIKGLTKYNSLQEIVSSMDEEETREFVYWLSENVFGANKVIEDQLEKLIVE